MHPSYQFWTATKDTYFQIGSLVNHTTASQTVFEKITWSQITSTVIRQLRLYTESTPESWWKRLKRSFATSKQSKQLMLREYFLCVRSWPNWVTYINSLNTFNKLLITIMTLIYRWRNWAQYFTMVTSQEVAEPESQTQGGWPWSPHFHSTSIEI